MSDPTMTDDTISAPSARKKSAYQRGINAEKECAAYLEAKGYVILALRLRTAGGEIDILARRGDMLAIVEVKAHARAEDGLYAVTPAKQRRIAQAAGALLAAPEIAGLPNLDAFNMRFDVMAAPDGAPIVHIEDAWRM